LPAQQAALELQPVFGDALDAAHGQAAVVGDVGGLAGPGRHRAQARHHHHQRAVGRAGVRLAVVQQRGQRLRGGGRSSGCVEPPVHMARRDAGDARSLQRPAAAAAVAWARKSAERIAALEVR
jgi:hypothetical protein